MTFNDVYSMSTQVLRLLDVVGLPELVIQLATVAITEAGDDWKGQVRAHCRSCAVQFSTEVLCSFLRPSLSRPL